MLRATNNLIKDLKKQKRTNSSLLFLDNIKIINDAIKHGLKPKIILVENENLNIWGNSFPIYLVEHKVIEQLSDCITPQGVLCVTEYPQYTVTEKPKTNFLVLDTLQDPGNVGTLIRTAVACNFKEIFLLDSVKISNPKLIRSSVGTIFDASIHNLSKENFIKLFTKWGNTILLKADMNGENIFKTEFNKEKPIGLVMGNEGQGVSALISNICNKTISLPMEKNVESLNVAVSGAVIMYQIYAKTGNL